MKWCMVAAMAVSLLFGSVAFAQEDNFDLDALLGDVGMEEAAAEAPVAEDMAAPVEESTPIADAVVPAAEEDMAAPMEEAVMEEVAAPVDEMAPMAEEAADPFADFDAVEEVPAPAAAPVEESVALMDEMAPVAEEAAPAVEDGSAVPMEELAPMAEEAADPFADLDAVEEVAAPLEEPAPVAVDETILAEEPFAPVDAQEMPVEEDLLGDLFAEPAAEDVAAPMDEMPLDTERMTDEPVDDFMMGEAAEASTISPVARKKAKKETEKLSTKELKKIAKETAEQEEVRRQAAEAEALKASETGFRALTDGDLITAENAFSAALKGLPDRPQNVDVRDQISWGLAEAEYLRARAMVQKKERLEDARKLVDAALSNDEGPSRRPGAGQEVEKTGSVGPHPEGAGGSAGHPREGRDH